MHIHIRLSEACKVRFNHLRLIGIWIQRQGKVYCGYSVVEKLRAPSGVKQYHRFNNVILKDITFIWIYFKEFPLNKVFLILTALN